MSMNRKIYPRLGLVLLVVGLISFSALNTLLFGSLRLDLTENRLYTISPGTREIIDSIEEPIDLYFFYSDRATRELAPLRSYAKRVRELIEEYALQANGKIRLRIIDPVPFSEAEDQAAEFGLQAVPLDQGGEQVYFGLAGTNAYGDQQHIAFFQPEREEFLEYELSKLVHSLVTVKKPVVGLISGLQINGGFDMMSSSPTPAWAVMEQLQQGFEVRNIAPQADKIDPDITTLMIVHPTGLSDALQYAIDQFVLKGGKAIVYVDPYCESAKASANPLLEQGSAPTSSNLEKLFKAWGVQYSPDKVVGDAGTALQISFAADQPPVKHLGFLGLGVANLARDDVVTGNLELLNLGMAGALAPAPGASTRFEPLMQSSDQAALLDSMQVQVSRDPSALLKGFMPSGERYTLAARISGPAKSAFAAAQTEGQEHIAESEDINLIVVADADMLADRFWVQVQDFFGQRLATAWADNASFAQNALENLGGSSSLIGIRSRGRFSRPFDRVEQIRLNADARYRASAEQLQQRLDETEQKLGELQRSREQNNQLVLSPEQEHALLEFQDEKLRIRKELREVRHQLDQDIEHLGMLLKLVNILIMPLLLTLLLYGWHVWRRGRGAARRKAGQGGVGS
jgi:ABC-type uncharacterized transport system involved in gliding motility auxiliary subunit